MANETVFAIGVNIFPSTPVNVRIGIYTMRIMICPKAAEFIIFSADSSTAASISDCESSFLYFFVASRCSVASTIITAPSTIKPKSIAPKLIKFALTPKTFIIPSANSMDKGIAEATIKPARRFPRNKTNTKMTISAPSTRFFSTVFMARSTRSVRSKYGSMTTSAGSDF